MKRMAWWVGMASTCFATLVLIGLLGASAMATPEARGYYPSTSEDVCEQGYGGSFTSSAGSRTCTVVFDGGTTLYAGFGAGAFD